MWFLIRSSFWFSLVLLALPLGNDPAQPDAKQVNAIEAIIAASEAVSDIAGMCDRKPGVCETGATAISTISVRAREASRIAYEKLGQPEADKADDPLSHAIKSHSAGQIVENQAKPSGQNPGAKHDDAAGQPDQTITGTIPTPYSPPAR